MILKLFLNNILSQNLHCKFIALKHMGQGKQIKIIFLFHEWIREAKPLLFFYLSFFFFFNSNYSILRISCGNQVFKVKHSVFATQNLENLVCKNSFMKKNKKKLLEELWTIVCIQWLLLFIRLNVKGLWVSLEI